MAKLTIQKPNVEEEENSNNFSTSSLSIKKTVEKPPAEETYAHNASKQSPDIAQWLIDNIGEENFMELKDNPNFQLPYSDNEIDLKTWLKNSLKTLFSMETLNNIADRLQNLGCGSEDEIENIVQEKMAEKVKKYNERFKAQQAQIDDLSAQLSSTAKPQTEGVSLAEFLSQFHGRNFESNTQRSINQLLMEAANNPKSMKFVIGFSKNLAILDYTLKHLSKDEKENMDRVYEVLTELLGSISGNFITERRELLEQIAKYCNEFFTQYDFISPEQTLNVDPDLHNAGGLGSNRVKEGITFAVIRRDTKKTVKYADILAM